MNAKVNGVFLVLTKVDENTFEFVNSEKLFNHNRLVCHSLQMPDGSFESVWMVYGQLVNVEFDNGEVFDANALREKHRTVPPITSPDHPYFLKYPEKF